VGGDGPLDQLLGASGDEDVGGGERAIGRARRRTGHVVEHGDPGPIARSVGHLGVLVDPVAKVDERGDEEEHEREYERRLHDDGAAVASPHGTTTFELP
jgi:hypothetical protein